MVVTLDLGFENTIPLVTREDWGAHLARRRAIMFTPVTNVRYTDTGTSKCITRDSCSRAVKALQEAHLDTGFHDIPFNFLVGGDGSVYEGRGWQLEPDLPGDFDKIRDNCIDIGYIGDFKENDPPWEMLSVGMDLLRFGIKIKKIDPVFNLIPYSDRGKPKINETEL